MRVLRLLAPPDCFAGFMMLLFAASFVVAACNAPQLVTVCPTPVVYTAEMQARAADELEALPPDSPLREMIADYIRERAQLRLGAQP